VSHVRDRAIALLYKFIVPVPGRASALLYKFIVPVPGRASALLFLTCADAPLGCFLLSTCADAPLGFFFKRARSCRCFSHVCDRNMASLFAVP